ncbi:MAG: DotA/TraY family protein [Alphaproteobacteria bacterium]|nr:DotA/TraY family protein [Alphaproteobacteria bacterium]
MAVNKSNEEPMVIRPGAVLGYMAMPQVLPRIRTLFGSGFGFFAFVLAQIYRSVRLLPEGHPYLNPVNRNHFNFVQVIATAANNLKWRRDNIDQIIVFIALLCALVILVLQAVALVMGFLIPTASADGLNLTIDHFNSFTKLFTVLGDGGSVNPNAAKQDIAMILLDRVFGVPGIFNSCVSTGSPCYAMMAGADGEAVRSQVYAPTEYPWPFHGALHSVFKFYSISLLVIAVLIFFYFIVVVVAETAQTGTPFGKRFNHVWAPLRLVLAFGLLIPLGAQGLNGAQYTTLYMAKWGSNLATNGWNLFNATLDAEYQDMARSEEYLGRPSVSEAGLQNFVAYIALAKTCAVIEGSHYFPLPSEGASEPQAKLVMGYIVKSFDRIPYLSAANTADVAGPITAPDSVDYDDVNAFTQGQDIFMRIGHYAEDHVMHKGRVMPYCGEMSMPVTDLTQPGAHFIRSEYIQTLIPSIWNSCNIRNIANYYWSRFRQQNPHDSRPPDDGDGEDEIVVTGCTPAEGEEVVDIEDNGDGIAEALTNAVDAAQGRINLIITAALQKQQEETNFTTPDTLIERGWAGAGVFYNRIATLNGAMFSAAWGLPTATMMPAIMQGVNQLRLQTNPSVDPSRRYDPQGLDMGRTEGARDNDEKLAQTMFEAHRALFQTGFEITQTSGNVLYDVMNLLFGTEGLFNLKNEANARLHPLAQLTGVGRSLIESTIQNGMLGMAAYGFGALAGFSAPQFADTFGTLGGLFFTLASIGLVAGFILFYVVPFLPFLYFFFAVGNWLKAVFEAIVGVPLWALAHIRIDGNGLPGDAASGGYFLLLEIMLRPILIVFGLIAGVSIFGALGHVLHDIYFTDVLGYIDDAAGIGPGNAENPISATEQLIGSLRSPVDDFFHLVMYAIIMYLLAMSSFKLIDLIPQQIMRWMGSNVQSFGDQSMDAGQQLTQYAAFGGYGVFGQVSQAAQQLGGAGISLGRGMRTPETPQAPQGGG